MNATTLPLSKAIGLEAWLITAEGFACPVTIQDAKVSYGTVRFLLEAPQWQTVGQDWRLVEHGGELMTRWVAADRVRVATPNGMVAGTHFAQGAA